jgi:hypothetical protein
MKIRLESEQQKRSEDASGAGRSKRCGRAVH